MGQDNSKQSDSNNASLSTHNPIKDVRSVSSFDLSKLKTLGTGSFGRVILVYHPPSQKYFAVKVLRKEKIKRMKQVEHVRYEKGILENIECPFIVNLLTSFQDAKNLYLAMEYVTGGEMFYHLRKASRFTDDVARFYAAQVVLAWEYLHSMNIVYRDLKPENILIAQDGNIKITDFGFAKRIVDRAWTVCGTPEYLAPEIILSKGYGLAVDWWALGILIYEMLVGYPPFYDDDPYEIYEKIVACRPRFPAFVSPIAHDLITKLLQVDLTKRYGNLKGGANDIKQHKWFAEIDWAKMSKLQVTPPFVPTVASQSDTSNFQPYEEDNDLFPSPGCADPYAEDFRDW